VALVKHLTTGGSTTITGNNFHLVRIEQLTGVPKLHILHHKRPNVVAKSICGELTGLEKSGFKINKLNCRMFLNALKNSKIHFKLNTCANLGRQGFVDHLVEHCHDFQRQLR